MKPEVVRSSIKIQLGPEDHQWVEIYPMIEIVESGDAYVISIAGTFLIQGDDSDTWRIRRLA